MEGSLSTTNTLFLGDVFSGVDTNKYSLVNDIMARVDNTCKDVNDSAWMIESMTHPSPFHRT